MALVAASKARIPSRMFNEVANRGKRVPIQGRGGDTVYLISSDDMARLEAAEDKLLARAGREALAEFEQSGAKPIPWAQTRKKAGF